VTTVTATAARPTRSSAVGPLTGTLPLVRLALRRDRIIMPLWVALFVLVATGSAGAVEGLYPDAAALQAAGASINGTPSLVALYGRVYDETSLGAVAMWKMAGTGAILVAILAIMLMVRHTRADEESGRSELVGAGVVGRFAPLTAAFVVVGGMNVGLGLLTAAGLASAGLPSSGSVAFGMAWAMTGISFAAVAAVSAQVPNGARAATGLAVTALGATYLLRAVGDSASADGPRWLSWLSPIGWGQQVRPFAGNRWGVLLVPVAFALLATALAYLLVSRRDVGSGMVGDRPGRPTAAQSLRTPLALAFRLQRGSVVAWTLGFAVLAFVLGSIASQVGDLLNTPGAQQMIARLGGQDALVDAYLATSMGVIGIVASVFGVQSVLRLRGEETALRAEHLLATATTRRQWAASHLTVAVLGVVWLLVVAGLVAGLAHARATGDAGQVWRLLGGALVQLPAALVLVGFTIAAYGLSPRLAAAGWGAVAVFLLIAEVGPLFELSHWVMDLSPFTHTPKLPGPSFSAVPLIWLAALAVGLVAVGIERFRRRDLG
jgi:ABC-2 type transport system permease protein